MLFAIGAQAKNRPPDFGGKKAALAKPLSAETDKNGNKIFDSLDSKIKTKGPSAKTRVIVLFDRSYQKQDIDQLAKEIGPFTVNHKYDRVPGIATSLSNGQIAELALRPDVVQIEDDKKVTASLNTAINWFGIQKARTDFGVDGNSDGSPGYSKNDMVIAIIDTGIDIGHVDLDNGKVIGWQDFVKGQATAYDDAGHGTHVSSIAAGEGDGNPANKGVAPGAALVGIKVLDRRGEGYMSDVTAGIQWAIDNKSTYGIDVINLSLGTDVSSNGSDATSLMANSAMADDIVVTVSAGNEGPARYTIGSPGAAADVITVGAMADLGHGGFSQAYFSSRGPTADNRIKPDISAPGWQIMAAKAGGPGNQYVEKSGTSMASPFTAGVAALMRQVNTALSATDIKNTIMSTARGWGPAGTDIDYGAGRLEGYHAIKAAAATPGRTISTPKHAYLSGALSASVTEEWWNIDITDNTYPIGVTMIMSNWSGSANPDFDMTLFDPGNNQVSNAVGVQRQETINHQPAQTGTYQLVVYRYAGAGDYFVDLSAGTHVISITLDTDGALPFGALGFGETTTTGDAQKEIVRVDGDTANLDIRTSLFSGAGNDWTLGATNGNEVVKWEFSPNNQDWTTFLADNINYPLADELASAAQQAVYFRLTMPNASSSGQTHSSLVTITAVAP